MPSGKGHLKTTHNLRIAHFKETLLYNKFIVVFSFCKTKKKKSLRTMHFVNEWCWSPSSRNAGGEQWQRPSRADSEVEDSFSSLTSSYALLSFSGIPLSTFCWCSCNEIITAQERNNFIFALKAAHRSLCRYPWERHMEQSPRTCQALW